jgi:hypothetical protein
LAHEAVIEKPGASQRAAFLWWGAVGLVAQVAFMAGWLIPETWQGPRYDPIRYTISDLQAATAPHIWFPITCFAIGGVGSCAFVVFGLRPALARAGRKDAYSLWMLALATLALGNSFPLIPFRLIDPGATAARQLHTAGGLTDALVSGIAFLVLVLTAIPLGRRLALLPEWRRLAALTKVVRVLGLACYIALGISSSAGGAYQGLLERMLVCVCVAWLAALGVGLIRNADESSA